MHFTYRLTGLGWSEATISDGQASVTLTASYLSDALANLIEALIALLGGAEQAIVSWDEEPGEYRWVFTRSDDQVHLRLTALGITDADSDEDESDESDESEGQAVLVFETRQRLVAFAAAVAEGAAQVLADQGEEKYLKRWDQHPVPTDLLHVLQNSLSGR